MLARDEALAATRSKERFLSNMSHELIINEVLDFAKIGAGKMPQTLGPIDVQAIVQSVMTLFSAAAQSQSIDLELEADPSLAPRRIGDSLHLRQVLMNLVGNALKFAPQGRVVLGVHPVGDLANDRVRFEVSDSGFGIDPSQQEKIFEPFSQVDQPGQSAQGGTGLGLTISRELVHAMGGELGVVSSPGHGSTLGFDLTPAHAPPVVDGYEPTQRLREIERLQGGDRTPVIALTANAFSTDVDRCLAAGMDAHVAKPFKKEALEAILAPRLPSGADEGKGRLANARFE